MIALLACSLWGCRTTPPNVHFVVPDGYRGMFRLEIDSSAASVPTVDGRVTYTIPPTGRLAIPTAAPLEDWHTTTASWSSGEDLPVSGVPTAPSGPDVVKLNALGASSEGWHTYVVGTDAEFDRAKRGPPRDLPLGSVTE